MSAQYLEALVGSAVRVVTSNSATLNGVLDSIGFLESRDHSYLVLDKRVINWAHVVSVEPASSDDTDLVS